MVDHAWQLSPAARPGGRLRWPAQGSGRGRGYGWGDGICQVVKGRWLVKGWLVNDGAIVVGQ